MPEAMRADQELIKAKYSRPKPGPSLVSRRRISENLDRALAHALTVVTAPAGYGKSTAVLDWLASRDLPAAWLSLDEHDNAPVVFWRYVCAVLDDIAPGIARDTEYVFSAQSLMDAHIHINILIDRMSAVPADFLLVLDDLHTVADPSILSGLSYLIDYLPERMHLICISRAEPDLDLPRRSLRQRILRLDQSDLRFAQDEIVRFYQARGHALDGDDIKRVEAYTEGWAASLVAIAMSMERGDRDAIAALPRASRDIERYLREEVIGAWRPEKKEFAMKTCILDTLSVPLCDAVTGGHDARAMLNELSEGNGFLTVLDEEKEEYRYHHLFKSLLHTLLTETFPDLVPVLHKRAARWYQDQGHISRTIEHLLSGGAYDEGFELIERETDPLVFRADYGTLLSYIARLPESLRDKSQQVALIHAMYYAEIGRYDLARQWMDRARELAAADRYSSDPGWSSYLRIAHLLMEANLLIREGNTGFLSLVASAAESNKDSHYLMPEYFDLNTADIYFYRSPVRVVANLFGKDPARYDTMSEDYRTLLSVNPGFAPLVPGEYLYEHNRLEEALPYLLKAMEEARTASCPGALVPAMVDIARLRRARGDMRGAYDALTECERQIADIGKGHWVYLLQAFRCRLYIDAGMTDEVNAWFASRRIDIYTEANRIREFELIVYARVLLSQDRLEDAGVLLNRLLAFTQEADRPHSRVEVLNLLALLDFGNNHVRSALKYIDESLGIGLKEGYVRSYIDELIPMAQVLRAYIKSRGKQSEEHLLKERKAFAASVLKQIPGSLLPTIHAQNEITEGLAEKIWEQLTDQEKKVLELMVNAATNQEICDTLGISLWTVKTHTGSIYAKLGVKNRSQCIKLVRDLGVL